MKIAFIGTSYGLPLKNRAMSSTMISVGDRHYIFDMGAPVGEYLANCDIDVKSVKAVFNSHFHADHFFGGLNFLSSCDWYLKGKATLPVYLPEEGVFEAVKGLLLAANKDYDLSGELSDFPRVALREHFNFIVTECTHFEPSVLHGVLEKTDADNIAITHIVPGFAGKLKALDPRYIIPNDGDKIEF